MKSEIISGFIGAVVDAVLSFAVPYQMFVIKKQDENNEKALFYIRK
jgi:hypothetical protein